MAENHVVIVDFNHQLHIYHNSQHRLSAKIVNRGVVEDKDTTIQNGTIKNIHRWSKHGSNPMAVCFDRSALPRKVFFQSAFGDMKVGTAKEYKGNRERMPEEMFIASQDVYSIFMSAGVPSFAVNGYEADDLIKACIDRAKVKYPGMHIDVVTNDADLLPLVDQTVSVYLRSMKGTFAEKKEFEKTHYIEVTPRNYSQVVENLSAYKGFRMPYNVLLLHKLLRGDMSDQFGCKDIARMFPASKWNALMDRMEADNVDFSSSFRYGSPSIEIRHRGTDAPFFGTMKDAINSPERDNLYQKVCNPKELDIIIKLLRSYTALTEEQLNRVEKLYWGMNLNMLYPNQDRRFVRPQFKLTDQCDINPFNEVNLHKAASTLQIQVLR